jgi:endopeptidase Clp ATP-binding regulatory subunit ClpX
MKTRNENAPDKKDIEKEISDFLTKKFGGEVKVISSMAVPRETASEMGSSSRETPSGVNFDLKPEDLIAYLDQYIVRQEQAKSILATKICTHFNRIARERASGEDEALVGRIKNNVLMIGPTGVGKTYMIRLIARKLGVPFVKGDATKFSETGYVGGDVEDLVRDLVREADDDVQKAEYGIVYIDEIDKIAASPGRIGADVSRGGVQRALLKPMEETEVELKAPHDPISMFQELERFRKTGKRERTTINTRNILFIMSGAFGELSDIIQRRLRQKEIGFGARVRDMANPSEVFREVRSEDLIAFGFESEFVGRLPVTAVLERLTQADLHDILRNPNNPVILAKKQDFAAYGIEAVFDDDALGRLADAAYRENTGARGLVSAIERALLPLERRLPSTPLRHLPITEAVIRRPEAALADMCRAGREAEIETQFNALKENERDHIRRYLTERKGTLAQRHNLSLTPSRIELVADFYVHHVMDVGAVLRRIKSFADDVKNIELYFYKTHDINIVMEDDAIDFLIDRMISRKSDLDSLFKQINLDFEYGLKLVRDRTGKNRFFITRKALESPDAYIGNLLQNEPPESEIRGSEHSPS